MEHWEEEGKIRRSFYFELPLWILTFFYLMSFGLSWNVFFIFAGLILINLADSTQHKKSITGYVIVIGTMGYGVIKHLILER